jgi:hypothetical protein
MWSDGEVFWQMTHSQKLVFLGGTYSILAVSKRKAEAHRVVRNRVPGCKTWHTSLSWWNSEYTVWISCLVRAFPFSVLRKGDYNGSQDLLQNSSRSCCTATQECCDKLVQSMQVASQ